MKGTEKVPMPKGANTEVSDASAGTMMIDTSAKKRKDGNVGRRTVGYDASLEKQGLSPTLYNDDEEEGAESMLLDDEEIEQVRPSQMIDLWKSL